MASKPVPKYKRANLKYWDKEEEGLVCFLSLSTFAPCWNALRFLKLFSLLARFKANRDQLLHIFTSIHPSKQASWLWWMKIWMDQNSSLNANSSAKRRKNVLDASERRESSDEEKTAILSIDIGTTNLKCSLYDRDLQCLYSCSSKLNILHPRENYSEIDPDDLFRILKENMDDCLRNCPSKWSRSSP